MSVRSAIVTVVALAVVGAGVYAVLEPTKVFGVNSTGLEGSIDRELGSNAQNPADLECEQRRPGRAGGAGKSFESVWRCQGTRFGSEPTAALVGVDSDGCWRIVRGFDDEFRGREACINIWDATGSPLF